MRKKLVGLCMLLGAIAPAWAQISIGVGLPGVSMGIDLPVYPQLVRVPGYPVYYAPQMNSNYFFYDGMYWVYERDNWYASTWYNGPWGLVSQAASPHGQQGPNAQGQDNGARGNPAWHEGKRGQAKQHEQGDQGDGERNR